MKARDWLVAGAVAAATCVVALSVGGALSSAIAGQGAAERRQQPVLEVDGVQLGLALDSKAYEPGQEPTVLLKAVNRSDRPVDLHVSVQMMTLAVASPYSRRAPMPAQVWQESCDVVLDAGESGVFMLPTGFVCREGQTVSFLLAAGGQSMTAAAFSVPRQGANGQFPAVLNLNGQQIGAVSSLAPNPNGQG